MARRPPVLGNAMCDRNHGKSRYIYANGCFQGCSFIKLSAVELPASPLQLFAQVFRISFVVSRRNLRHLHREAQDKYPVPRQQCVALRAVLGMARKLQ